MTTEGGLDAVKGYNYLKPYVRELVDAGIRVSLVDPEKDQLDAAVSLVRPSSNFIRVPIAKSRKPLHAKPNYRIQEAAAHAAAIPECHAGHGLAFDTVAPIAAIPTIVELNIGHFLIGEAVFGGLEGAIKQMRALMDRARAEE